MKKKKKRRWNEFNYWYNDLAGAVTALTRKQEASELSRRKLSSPGLRRQSTTTTSAPVVTTDNKEEYDDIELPEQCPEPNGFFADPEQCDKYFDCRDGNFTVKLCPDGLVFNDFSPEHEKCDLPFGIDCTKRPKRRKFLFINFSFSYFNYKY